MKHIGTRLSLKLDQKENEPKFSGIKIRGWSTSDIISKDFQDYQSNIESFQLWQEKKKVHKSKTFTKSKTFMDQSLCCRL